MRAMLAGAMVLTLVGAAAGQGPRRGPFDPEAWPPTIDATKKVHFISVDNALKPPSDNWLPNLKILTGGDHPTEPVKVGIAGRRDRSAVDELRGRHHRS